MEIKMEKLFTDKDYSNKAIEANEQGKKLYVHVHDVEYQAEVLEWNYVEKEITRQKIDPETGEPMYDDEGNPIMETVIILEPYPKMVEETYIDPETCEEKQCLFRLIIQKLLQNRWQNYLLQMITITFALKKITRTER